MNGFRRLSSAYIVEPGQQPDSRRPAAAVSSIRERRKCYSCHLRGGSLLSGRTSAIVEAARRSRKIYGKGRHAD